MNEGLSYYQFTYLVLRDVRIVYAPPKSIGFFGGDPDNFDSVGTADIAFILAESPTPLPASVWGGLVLLAGLAMKRMRPRS